MLVLWLASWLAQFSYHNGAINGSRLHSSMPTTTTLFLPFWPKQAQPSPQSRNSCFHKLIHSHQAHSQKGASYLFVDHIIGNQRFARGVFDDFIYRNNIVSTTVNLRTQSVRSAQCMQGKPVVTLADGAFFPVKWSDCHILLGHQHCTRLWNQCTYRYITKM